jgi:hypothetical protein
LLSTQGILRQGISVRTGSQLDPFAVLYCFDGAAMLAGAIDCTAQCLVLCGVVSRAAVIVGQANSIVMAMKGSLD